MLVLLSAIVVSVAVLWAGFAIAREIARARQERARDRALQVLAVFAPGVAASAENARALLTWQPLAATARTLFPAELEILDRAAGATFPFTREYIEAAHAQWSADWLTWERTHDAEYKLKAAMIEAEVAASGGSAIGRARLDGVDREKLELYQRRYSEYVRVSKALQALIAPAAMAEPRGIRSGSADVLVQHAPVGRDDADPRR